MLELTKFELDNQVQQQSSPRYSSTKRGLSNRRAWVMIVVPTLVTLLIAFVFGLGFNLHYFGGAWENSSNGPSTSVVNCVATALQSAALAIGLALLGGMIWVMAPGYTPCWNFLIYFVLALTLIWNSMVDVPSMLPSAAGTTNQVIELLDAEFNWTDEKFAKSFLGLQNAHDFYHWLRGPFKTLLTAGPNNEATSGSDVNGPTQFSNISAGWANVMVLQARIRQVRVNLQAHERPLHFYFGRPVVIDKKVPVYSNEVRNTGVRTFSGAYTEEVIENAYHTEWGKTFDSPDLVLPSLEGFLKYPGKAGQVLSSSHGGLHMTHGAWTPADVEVGQEAAFSAAVDSDIAFMEANRWIDHLTSMVTVELAVVNPNNNLGFGFLYAVQFANSGRVIPQPPFITVAKLSVDKPIPDLYIPLVYAFYYLALEIQKMCLGLHQYWHEQMTLGSLLDITNIAACLGLAGTNLSYLGWYSATDEPSWWASSAVLIQYQHAVGISLFMVVLKSLRFTQKIPVMCHIGNAFAHVALDIVLFLCVMLVLFVAFALLFYANFRLVVSDFSSFPDTLFYMFQGLQGDMDVKQLITVDPFLGPIVYAAYVTIMLYIGFTLLIGVITVGYDAVRMQPCEPGTITRLVAKARTCLARLCGVDKDGSEESVVEATDAREDHCDIARQLQHQQELLERILKKMDAFEAGVIGATAEVNVLLEGSS